MRTRTSLTTVLAVLALVISMTGTAVAAAVIITSNDQVAAHTIAGANAPVGDNENLISGSVGTSDLHGNAVTGAKVASDTLTGADINESTLRLSNVIANPTGGTLGAGGLTTGSATPYPLANASFTQRPGEIVEFIPQVTATLAVPSGKVSPLCQVEIDLELDGTRLAAVTSASTSSQQLETTTVAVRKDAVLPAPTASTTHTVTASARLAGHSGDGFTDDCTASSQVDAFAFHVIGTR
ncbi:MAG: hypothetical protein ACJ77A_02790 [Actinomycetota bacterium]